LAKTIGNATGATAEEIVMAGALANWQMAQVASSWFARLSAQCALWKAGSKTAPPINSRSNMTPNTLGNRLIIESNPSEYF
jgi:hypothetical protein